ncbi:hypothetical protein HU200_022175 [Digitaria exilis]|uniref:Uncharacterized protein n=1 Tax=Digitaria exilis TaxID=1010633 RepID=A0A835CE86_9POAL|nr:hypothetical protein HU200_022175 [Digitaria exilis]
MAGLNRKRSISRNERAVPSLDWAKVPLAPSSHNTTPPEHANQQTENPSPTRIDLPAAASMASTSDPCAICLSDISRGQAVFTAECSHTFHHRCISDSVAHGNRNCPLCKATWRDVPAVDPSAPAPAPPRRPYAHDEETVAQNNVVHQADADGVGQFVLKTHCELSAVARDESRDNFAVLVHATAPEAAADAARAPLDLVTVLDVSSSMQGEKLALLKQAMRFVIDNLGPADRLSVVSFSDTANRRIRLVRMSDAGKASAKLAVESLVARGCTNIGDGLKVASEVLANRRYRNAVSSVILLSDGQDNLDSGSRPGPMHTFGFGTDHDAAAMHAIAEVTGGTFAFVENQEVIQDSFAQCIGGLLSVVVQDAHLAVTCVHPGVRVREVKSGRYESLVAEDGQAASVVVGELYAGEERRFLLFVDVPGAEAADDEDATTMLVRVRCTYRDTSTGREIDVDGEDAVVQRPVEVTTNNLGASKEVERERVRVAAVEDMAAARAAAERGEHAEAGRILQRRRQAVMQSAAGDPAYDALLEELEDLSARAEDRGEYERTGRACMLTGMSTHAQQRGTLLAPFVTKAARRMVDMSQVATAYKEVATALVNDDEEHGEEVARGSAAGDVVVTAEEDERGHRRDQRRQLRREQRQRLDHMNQQTWKAGPTCLPKCPNSSWPPALSLSHQPSLRSFLPHSLSLLFLSLVWEESPRFLHSSTTLPCRSFTGGSPELDAGELLHHHVVIFPKLEQGEASPRFSSIAPLQKQTAPKTEVRAAAGELFDDLGKSRIIRF